MSDLSDQASIPGGDLDMPTLAQEWRIVSWPDPEAIARIVDSFGESMRAPLRRYCAINSSLVRDARGSWVRNRSKALDALRDGRNGHPIIYFDVTSWIHGGDNKYPESSISFSRTGDAPDGVVTVRCEHSITTADDPARIAASWAETAETLLDLADEPGAPIIGRHENGTVVAYSNTRTDADGPT